MKLQLSEAIRLGALLAPKAKDGFVDGEGRCALAGACDALGIPSIDILVNFKFSQHGLTEAICRRSMNYGELERRYPMLLRCVDSPPCCRHLARPELREVIWTLNDVLGWSREEIADYVATLEAQQDQPQETPALAEVV